MWSGTNFETMSIFDRVVPNGNLEYFVKGSLIHQVLNLDAFPNMIKTYRNDKANYVRLAISEPKFYNFMNKASFISSLSYRLDLFLLKEKESVEFTYCLKVKNTLKDSYYLVLLIKEKNKVLSNIFIYNNKAEVDSEKERIKNLSEKISSYGNSWNKEKYAQLLYSKKKQN